MQEVEAMCDRVIIINKGEIVADKSLQELRQGNTQTIVVEFDYRIEDAFIKRIANVITVKNTYGFVYEITFDTMEDRRPQVFDFAKENDLKILELHQKTANLESMFRELTQN
jgi:ABC-2 type transport system ATP-binding protein